MTMTVDQFRISVAMKLISNADFNRFLESEGLVGPNAPTAEELTAIQSVVDAANMATQNATDTSTPFDIESEMAKHYSIFAS